MARGWVIKFGGSLIGDPGLGAWLAALCAPARGAPGVVVVPGGGPFADAVRAAQIRYGFSDLAAHRMAILAMEQYAWMLADRAPDLVPAADLTEIERAWRAGRPALWLPARLTFDAADLEASWSVTSDSLATWLARRLAAEALIFVKSAPVASGTVSLAALEAAEILDPMVVRYLVGYHGAVRCLRRDRQAVFAEGWRLGRPPGTVVTGWSGAGPGAAGHA